MKRFFKTYVALAVLCIIMLTISLSGCKTTNSASLSSEESTSSLDSLVESYTENSDYDRSAIENDTSPKNVTSKTSSTVNVKPSNTLKTSSSGNANNSQTTTSSEDSSSQTTTSSADTSSQADTSSSVSTSTDNSESGWTPGWY